MASGLDMLHAFVQLSPDSAFWGYLEPMDQHSLACTHRSLQRAVDERILLKQTPSPKEVRMCMDQIALAKSAISENTKLAKDLAEIRDEQKFTFRRFVELSKRRRLPREATFDKSEGKFHTIFMSSDGVMVALRIMGIYITVTSAMNKISACIYSGLTSMSQEESMNATWNGSLALGLAIVTHFFDIPLNKVVIEEYFPFNRWEDELLSYLIYWPEKLLS